MSRTAMNEILDRSMLDEDFRRAILDDPDGTLADYDLTAEERAALSNRDVDEATKLAGRTPTAAIIAVNISNLNSFITTIVYLENLIAAQPDVNDVDREQITRRCEEIKQMDGDRTELIKELLTTMW